MLEYVPILRMRKGDDLLVRVKLFDRQKSVLLHAKDALKVMFFLQLTSTQTRCFDVFVLINTTYVLNRQKNG